MAASKLNARKRMIRRIFADLKMNTKQVVIANELGTSQANISYRMTKYYPRLFEDFLVILDLAGYEVVEKENEDD